MIRRTFVIGNEDFFVYFGYYAVADFHAAAWARTG
jgi:hypothetical protein